MVSLRVLLLCAVPVAALQYPSSYGAKFSKRGLYIQAQTAKRNVSLDAPVVDLGYARYQGYHDASFDIYTYRGIRYASKPKRWQPPKRPSPGLGTERILSAIDNPLRCPQSPPGPVISNYSFERDAQGSEDCLFLNVFAPVNKTKLPVLFWIHGGGYGQDWAANYDFSHMSKTVGNGFLTVIIQYRLGAFGFASSAEIGHFGTPNAGLHDVRLALEWVQDYIYLFGGDPARVTIAGESAGGGAVMLTAMANNGSDGTSLFQRAIVSSPYLPTQWNHNDVQPSQAYYSLAAHAGCMSPAVTQNGSVYNCLQSVDSNVLQNASAYASMEGKWGQWAFLPVIDGSLISQRPTEQLLKGSVNGKSILSGNNANEGTLFVPTDVDTQDRFVSRMKLDYPLLKAENITAIMNLYNIAREQSGGTLYDTNGLTPPFATSVSGTAQGWLQAAYNLYAEATFVCPAMWLADAFARGDGNSTGQSRSWRYQYSPPPAFHDDDLDVLMKDVHNTNDTDGADESVGFRLAFQSIWGRFIIDGDPTLTDEMIWNIQQTGENVTNASTSRWSPWKSVALGTSDSNTLMLNLNLTLPEGGVAKFDVVNGFSWEGGRGDRCNLWADLGYWIQA